jgi:O-antigen/teichoic acid export membrane protein
MATDAPSAGETPSAPSLLRSGALSLVTSAAPLVVALVALPVLTRQLGTERLGFLALAWAWLGYAALLDFGLGRALTRMVAAADAGEKLDAPIGAYVATAHITLAAVGAIVGCVAAALAPWYVTSVLHASGALRTDAILGAVIFALTVPLITGSSVPRSVLEARQQFREVNLVRLPVSVGTFAVPLLLLPFTTSLAAIALLLSAVRAWAWWRYAALARKLIPEADTHSPGAAYLRPLLRAGAWMTVSNVLSPLMTIADRFVIGSLISVSAVALYAVPWEAVTKLWIVPGALTMVLFPAIARAATSEPEQMIPLHTASVRLLTLIVAPVCAVACLLAPSLLRLAGGAAYAGESVDVLRILAVGVAANCVATVPFTLLQACGRARWTATLHLLEIIPFCVALWFSVSRWGIIGAAVTWTLRVLIDASLMTWRAQSVAPLPASSLLLTAAGVASVAACALVGTLAPDASVVSLIIAVCLAGVIPVLLWNQRSAAERIVLERAGGRS